MKKTQMVSVGIAFVFAISFISHAKTTTNLWIAQAGISSGSLVGIASNSQPDISYEIQSLTDLTQAGAGWGSEGFIFGSELTNWTPMSVAQNGRTNLFLRIRSWADDGSGLPIWWQMQYFGMTGVDPYGNPAGDGWNNLQKFQKGMNPNVFYTPPTPQGLTVSYNSGSGTANVSWLPSPRNVTGYTVTDSDGHVFNLSASTTSIQENVTNTPNGFYNDLGDPTINLSFQVQSLYAGGYSAWSGTVPLELNTLSATFIAGPQDSVYLAISGLPANAVTLRLSMIDAVAHRSGNYSCDANHEISVSASTNGLYLIPAAWAQPERDACGNGIFNWWLQTSNADGSFSLGVTVANPFDDLFGSAWAAPYFDGRVQLKQNLIFQLREAPEDTAFHFWLWSSLSGDFGTFGAYTGNYDYPTNYVFSGLLSFYPFQTWTIDPYLPFEENCLFRNFVFSPADVDPNGYLTTGLYYNNNGLGLITPITYQFQTNWVALPNLLAASESRWLLYEADGWIGNHYVGNVVDAGIVNEDSDWNTYFTLSMPGNVRNWFGLPYVSANVVYIDYNNNYSLATNVLYAGVPFTLTGDNIFGENDSTIYPETAQPQFQTVEYDFWQPEGYDNYTPPNFDLVPGLAGFATTNTSRLMIRAVGKSSVRIAGYAKMAVANGYPGVYAFLGQYFDQAYTEDANGIATTNSAGLLSPYGDFFPTIAGSAALVTMPDVDTGARGTCTVYCVSLQLDRNHDGNMDLSFSGSDATSQANPMVWWVNNDCDISYGPADPGKDLPVLSQQPISSMSDCANSGIDSQRDLEDFARLWVCGMPTLPSSQGYTVTLSMSSVSGSPAINLFTSVETNGGIGYLTNSDIASAQIQGAGSLIGNGPGRKLGTISPSQSFAFPPNFFTNGVTKYFLFEGAGFGEGQLTMTISQNGNIIAQTGVWLDMHDVKDFYERAVITNNMSGSLSNWTSGVQTVQPATSSALGDDQDLIVLVHGINVRSTDCLQQGDTVFKRLYWAGYKGKFVTVKWPCNLLTPIPQPLNLDCFNRSEMQAYKASTALTNYLAQLRARFPGYRLHLLVHSQGNAIVSEAIRRGGISFDTYILTQGALPDSAYDVDAPINTDIASHEHGEYITPEWRPMGYHGIYTNFTGNIVNFYNPQDGVLDYWVTDQKFLKPSVYFDTSHYYYDGVNSYFYPVLADPYLVTDPEESRSMVSRSRTLPVGQSGPASGHGVIQTAVDLNVQFGFNRQIDEHSAQWTRPIQTSRPYYIQVLKSINP